MAKFSIGDRVKVLILPCANNLWTDYAHKHYAGSTGVVQKIDESDDTLYMEFDGGQSLLPAHAWFKQQGVEKLNAAPDVSRCSCGGPEKIVMILFQSVRVCTICKKEKS
jgi:hypothetical protein